MADLEYTAAEIAEIVEGTLYGTGEVVPSFVTIDSRKNVDGALFVALAGDRFDGHDFMEEVSNKGAAVVLAERQTETLSASQIVVADSLAALQRLALHHRKQYGGQVVAITGSCGKTTTRTLLASILSRKGITHQPVKNFNNHIGVPLTLLELRNTHEMAVLELGCSDFGEIELLTGLSLPHVGLVTNVGPAHLEKLGDLEGVARAKGELFAGLKESAIAVVNLDDPHVCAMQSPALTEISFGTGSDADVRQVSRTTLGADGQSIEMEVNGVTHEVRLPLVGDHNAIDAVATTAAALAMGASMAHVREGLETVIPAPGRLNSILTEAGTIVLDDTYNANPASVEAALRVLCELAAPHKRIAFLADMLELGDASAKAHEQIGELAASMALKQLVTMGDGGMHVRAGALRAGMDEHRCTQVSSHGGAARLGTEISERGDALLIKGSRGMKMEQVVNALLKGE